MASRIDTAFENYSQVVLVQLASDTTARVLFPDFKELLNELEQNPAAGDQDDRQKLFAAFAEKLDPTYDKAAGKSYKYLGWICRHYRDDQHNGHPILAEDFKKVQLDLNYLDKRVGEMSLRMDINQYKDFNDLSVTVQPGRDKQAAKRVKRDAARDGTTILYQDGEDKILLCHTHAAAQLHGLGTKWCITMAENSYFMSYNRTTPIIILMRGEEKWALVKKTFFRADDTVLYDQPANMSALLYKATKDNTALRDFIFSWMPTNSVSLQFLDESSRRDKEIVLSFIRQNGMALQYAHESLQRDKEVVLAAIRQDIRAIAYMDKSFYQDKEVVLAAVRKEGLVLQYADESLQRDKEVVLAAIAQSAGAFQFADESLRRDREFLLTVAEKSADALSYADESLWRNKEFLATAIVQNGLVLQYADENLRCDRDIVLAAVTQNGSALKYAGESLRQDKEVVLAAVTQSGRALSCAHESLQHDKEVVLAAVMQYGSALKQASESLRQDKEVVLAAVTQSGWALSCAHQSLQHDKEVVLAAVTQSGGALEHASESLRADKDVVLAAAANNIEALQFADKRLWQDADFKTGISLIVQQAEQMNLESWLNYCANNMPQQTNQDKGLLRLQRRWAGRCLGNDPMQYRDRSRQDFLPIAWGDKNCLISSPLALVGKVNVGSYGALPQVPFL